MTTDEIKAMFDAAGVIHTQAEHASLPNSITQHRFVSIKLGDHDRYINCPCYHDNYDDAYQCIWKWYIKSIYN